MIDIEYDIHYGKPTVENAMGMLKANIKLSKARKHKVVSLVVGYGSTGGTHKIKDATVLQLEEWKNTGYIKDYIKGEDLDIFSKVYQNFKYGNLFSLEEKNRHNPGSIYVII